MESISLLTLPFAIGLLIAELKGGPLHKSKATYQSMHKFGLALFGIVAVFCSYNAMVHFSMGNAGEAALAWTVFYIFNNTEYRIS